LRHAFELDELKKLSDIVVVGSSNTDMTIRLDRIPCPGETLLGGSFFSTPGGKGANQAVAGSRAGGKVSFVARLGCDSLGDRAMAGFGADHIDLAHITRDRRSASGVALIFVGKSGANSIAVASGANSRLSVLDVRRARRTIRNARVLLLQLETPLETVMAAARLGASNGLIVILNPAPARPLPTKLLRDISVLTPNESEAEMLTGIKISGVRAAQRAAKTLRRRGVQTVIVTLGAQGAFIDSDEVTGLVPGFKVKALDTTAAGDVFNGALAVALCENRPLEQATRFANAAAAISVTRRGAQPSAPSRSQIDRLLLLNER
jgi:ribokinase